MAFKTFSKKIILAVSSPFLFASLYCQEDGQPLKDLYPMGDKAPVSEEAPLSDDPLADILDGLDLTDEEKAMLEAPSSDDASKAASPEDQMPAENEFQEASDEAAFEDEASNEETSSENPSEESPSETEFEEEEPSESSESSGDEKKSPAGTSVVPAKKRPRPVDAEKAKAAEEKDETPDVP